MISLKHCYHGVSFGAMGTSGLEEDHKNYGPVLEGYVRILDKVIDLSTGANIKRKARLAKELASSKLRK